MRIRESPGYRRKKYLRMDRLAQKASDLVNRGRVYRKTDRRTLMTRIRTIDRGMRRPAVLDAVLEPMGCRAKPDSDDEHQNQRGMHECEFHVGRSREVFRDRSICCEYSEDI